VIQRIQSIYLLLAFIADGAVFFTPLYQRATEDPNTWIGYGLTGFLVLAGAMTLINIFRYTDRNRQRRELKWAMLMQVVALAFAVGIIFSLGGIGTYLWDEAIGTGLALLALILQLLASRSITKDIELVQSMDRIR